MNFRTVLEAALLDGVHITLLVDFVAHNSYTAYTHALVLGFPILLLTVVHSLCIPHLRSPPYISRMIPILHPLPGTLVIVLVVVKALANRKKPPKKY